MKKNKNILKKKKLAHSSLAVGTRTGYRLYTLNVALKLEEIHSSCMYIY
jgi:hypothetical protein